MAEISIEEISQDFPAYIQRVQAGESFVVLQAGTPVAEVVPTKNDSAIETKSTKATDFAEALTQFREELEMEGLDIDVDAIFADVRDRTPAPEEPRW